MRLIPSIDEIWIITQDGLTLYNEQLVSEPTDDLFGGFISAINAFASEIGMDNVQEIRGQNFKLILSHYQDHRLTFVCKSPLDQKSHSIQNYLQYLKKKFVDYYKDELVDWRGDMKGFEETKRLFNLERDQLAHFKATKMKTSLKATSLNSNPQLLYNEIKESNEIKRLL